MRKSEISQLMRKFGLDFRLKGTQRLAACVREFHARGTITAPAEPWDVMVGYAHFAQLRPESVYRSIGYALEAAGLTMGPCAAVRFFTGLGRLGGAFDED